MLDKVTIHVAFFRKVLYFGIDKERLKNLAC